MRPSEGGANYSTREVEALISEYAAVRAQADTTRPGLRHLVRMADLHRAIRQLRRDYREVVLLHGLLGLSQRETAAALQMSDRAVSKRYALALEEVVFNINGGLL